MGRGGGVRKRRRGAGGEEGRVDHVTVPHGTAVCCLEFQLRRKKMKKEKEQNRCTSLASSMALPRVGQSNGLSVAHVDQVALGVCRSEPKEEKVDQGSP